MSITAATIASKFAGPSIAAARKLLSNNLGKREARRLAVQYWGMVLFELRRNIEHAREMTRPGNQLRYGIFSVKTWESLFDLLAQLSPMPRMFSTIQDVNDHFAEIAAILRAAVDAPEQQTNFGSLGTHNERGGEHQWHDARQQASELLPRATQVLTDARSVVEGLGREAFDDRDWQTFEAEILPEPLD